jgi:hypothetical protein
MIALSGQCVKDVRQGATSGIIQLMITALHIAKRTDAYTTAKNCNLINRHKLNLKPPETEAFFMALSKKLEVRAFRLLIYIHLFCKKDEKCVFSNADNKTGNY